MKLRKFQEGGAMPVEDPAMAQGAPAEAGAQDPMQAIVEGAMQAVQTNNGDMALQVCAALVQLIQEQSGGAPQEAPAGEPVFKAGGKLKCRCGGKCKKAAKKC